ncbi:glycosyltransferase [Mucilaginibacter mali]|uniref:Glycosyltransferase n=1 Tax=Mucilaginibacter mali TaxID=2740462 RepID=A0A7D4TP28_9SPHI|nr:glycosyltransferase [Mucilaginibacter mali]QKJ30434.1 glycosyltransferase [Mucilaginibacter mali]
MTKPLISVIMPAFNAEKHMAESVETVINQTYQNWELIIVNDGSTDSTGAIAQQYALADKRIKLINQQNKKLSAARNTGIKASTGDWIAFLDADDLWVTDKLEKQIDIINTNPDIGLVFSDGYIFNDGDMNTDFPYGAVSGRFTGVQMYKRLYQGNYVPILSVLVKKTHLDKAGWQDEQFVACQDWDYWLRLAGNDVIFYGMPDRLFYYRRHGNNMSNDSNLMDLEKSVVFVKNFNRELFDAPALKNLKSFLNITICKLIGESKIKEALYLISKPDGLWKKMAQNIVRFLINNLKKNANYPVRLAFKTENLFA